MTEDKPKRIRKPAAPKAPKPIKKVILKSEQVRSITKVTNYFYSVLYEKFSTKTNVVDLAQTKTLLKKVAK